MWNKAVRFIVYSVFVLLWLCPGDAAAQDFEQMREEIRERQEKARADIEFLRTEISRIEVKLSESATEYEQRYRQFEQLEREISLRDQVLDRLQEEQLEISNELRVLQQAYDQYSEELEKLIENYQSILRHLYMHGRETELMLLVTAGSLNEMQVKSHYLRRFEEHREAQYLQIEEAQERIRVKETEMEQARQRNTESLAEARTERESLEGRKATLETLITELQQDRQTLERQLTLNRQQMDNLNRLITELIAEEERVRREEEERYALLEQERLRRLAEAENIQNPREREREIARYSEPIRRPDAITLTEVERGRIAEQFRASRGSLPWPVNEGVITTKFGNKVDPVFRTVISNFGIEISTEPRSPVHVVHDGMVTDVVDVHGYDTMIIVNHGNYITAYGNLTEARVRRNTVVRRGDVIGLSGDENSYNGSVVFFLVRDGNNNVDPQQWITSRPGPIP